MRWRCWCADAGDVLMQLILDIHIRIFICIKNLYLSHPDSNISLTHLFVSIMTKTMIVGRCGARFLLPSGAPSKCEASHSTCCSARGWWVSSWRCQWSPWWCSRCSSSPEDCMCDDCLYYEWEEVSSITIGMSDIITRVLFIIFSFFGKYRILQYQGNLARFYTIFLV